MDTFASASQYRKLYNQAKTPKEKLKIFLDFIDDPQVNIEVRRVSSDDTNGYTKDLWALHNIVRKSFIRRDLVYGNVKEHIAPTLRSMAVWIHRV